TFVVGDVELLEAEHPRRAVPGQMVKGGAAHATDANDDRVVGRARRRHQIAPTAPLRQAAGAVGGPRHSTSPSPPTRMGKSTTHSACGMTVAASMSGIGDWIPHGV